MSYFYHLYSLVPRTALGSAVRDKSPRVGALLLADGGIASLHPWPEYGDAPLDHQLSMLADGSTTNLLERTLHYASLDRSARERSEALSFGADVPQSHRLVTDLETMDRGALEGVVKIKVGASPALEARILNALAELPLTFRLDANCAFTFSEASDFWSRLDRTFRDKVEFFEDPCRYEEKDWNGLHEAGMPLAYDHYGTEPGGFHYGTRIIKPLVQNCDRLLSEESDAGKKLVITSALDHPFGQAIAAWEAGRAAQNHDGSLSLCGLLSHTAYESNSFSELLTVRDGRLITPVGAGFGFDDLLKAIPWKKLR